MIRVKLKLLRFQVKVPCFTVHLHTHTHTHTLDVFYPSHTAIHFILYNNTFIMYRFMTYLAPSAAQPPLLQNTEFSVILAENAKASGRSEGWW